MADSKKTNNNQNIVNFELKGIGPFSDRLCFDFQDKKDIRLAIYATNGTGKTFISRCFNELTTQKLSEDKYYPKMNLVSFGKDKGEFKVSL